MSEGQIHLDGLANTHNCWISDSQKPSFILVIMLSTPKDTMLCEFFRYFIIDPHSFWNVNFDMSRGMLEYWAAIYIAVIEWHFFRLCYANAYYAQSFYKSHLGEFHCHKDVLENACFADTFVTCILHDPIPGMYSIFGWVLKQLVRCDNPRNVNVRELKIKFSRQLPNISKNTHCSGVEHWALRF